MERGVRRSRLGPFSNQSGGGRPRPLRQHDMPCHPLGLALNLDVYHGCLLRFGTDPSDSTWSGTARPGAARKGLKRKIPPFSGGLLENSGIFRVPCTLSRAVRVSRSGVLERLAPKLVGSQWDTGRAKTVIGDTFRRDQKPQAGFRRCSRSAAPPCLQSYLRRSAGRCMRPACLTREGA